MATGEVCNTGTPRASMVLYSTLWKKLNSLTKDNQRHWMVSDSQNPNERPGWEWLTFTEHLCTRHCAKHFLHWFNNHPETLSHRSPWFMDDLNELCTDVTAQPHSQEVQIQVSRRGWGLPTPGHCPVLTQATREFKSVSSQQVWVKGNRACC